MAIVKSLTINLRGNTSRLKNDFKPAKQAVAGLQKQVTAGFSNIGIKIAGLAGAIIGVTSLAGAMMKLNTQFRQIDETAKAADKIGATVGEMQALKLAAGLAGTDINAVERSMLKLSQTLGKAIGGDNKSIEALQNIGLAVEDFEGLSATQSFGLVSDAINKLGSQAEQTAATMDIFGRGGAEIFNLIKGGSEAIDAATSDIQAFGVELTRVDAAKVEIANDAWTKMQTLIDGVFQQIAVGLAPAFAALIETVIALANSSGVMGSVATIALDAITVGVEIASRAFSFMAGVVRLVQATFLQVVTVILAGLAQIEKALIYFGGQTFDFGIATLAEASFQAMNELSKMAGENFSQAFRKNDFVDNFKKNLQEVQNRAEDVAAKVEGSIFARPITPEVQVNTDKMKFDKVNVQSAERGTQEAFATIFGQTQQRPMESLVSATEQGNQTLLEISSKLDRNELPQLAIAGDMF